MKNFWRAAFVVLLTACISCKLLAAEDFYQFAIPAQQERFTALTTQLRCLVCQNQNIAQSNSELASDLREQIYQQISHGKSDQEIVDYLVARYGNYILYRPPFDGVTLGLWFGPFILLIGGISYLLFYLRKKSREKMK